ncbi:hypothetical protein [Herbiconiux sp. L3-i23]|uniref:hypothetical protein n=1 Tax=Herbiconiux sp. L3-i23 TaxID=2905871 RepID=UPI00207439C1|nr:hypothetical protein [Herbiconiux sp. L3-i23]
MTASSLAAPSGADAMERIRELQSRIKEMQATTLQTKGLATSPMFAGLLPDGMMRAGAAYSIGGSLTLAMSMLAAPSAAGAWCGVVGVPEFGAQAAIARGIDLSRLVLVPDPGDHWLTVASALADVLTVVVVRPPRRVSDADAGRLAARLRKRDAALISLGEWPGSEARLTVTANEWSGLGDGHGMITGRRMQVEAEFRGRPSRRKWVRIDPVPADAPRYRSDPGADIPLPLSTATGPLDEEPASFPRAI